MSTAGVQIKIMPEGLDIDLDKLKIDAKDLRQWRTRSARW